MGNSACIYFFCIFAIVFKRKYNEEVGLEYLYRQQGQCLYCILSYPLYSVSEE